MAAAFPPLKLADGRARVLAARGHPSAGQLGHLPLRVAGLSYAARLLTGRTDWYGDLSICEARKFDLNWLENLIFNHGLKQAPIISTRCTPMTKPT